MIFIFTLSVLELTFLIGVTSAISLLIEMGFTIKILGKLSKSGYKIKEGKSFSDVFEEINPKNTLLTKQEAFVPFYNIYREIKEIVLYLSTKKEIFSNLDKLTSIEKMSDIEKEVSETFPNMPSIDLFINKMEAQALILKTFNDKKEEISAITFFLLPNKKKILDSIVVLKSTGNTENLNPIYLKQMIVDSLINSSFNEKDINEFQNKMLFNSDGKKLAGILEKKDNLENTQINITNEINKSNSEVINDNHHPLVKKYK